MSRTRATLRVTAAAALIAGISAAGLVTSAYAADSASAPASHSATVSADQAAVSSAVTPAQASSSIWWT
jgi:hypothetical protein